MCDVYYFVVVSDIELLKMSPHVVGLGLWGHVTVEVETVVEMEVESGTVVALGYSDGEGPVEADADDWLP